MSTSPWARRSARGRSWRRSTTRPCGPTSTPPGPISRPAKDNLSQVEGTSTSTTAAIHAANSQVALKQSSLDQAQAAFAAAKLRATISGIVAQVNIAKGDQVGSATNSGGQNSASAGSGTSGNGTSGNGTSGSGGSGGSGSGGGSSASAGTDITVISPNSYVVDT